MIDVLRHTNDLGAWLEVMEDFRALGLTAQQFYAARALPRDRPESEDEIREIHRTFVPRWERS
jgi:hypothetical protein